MKHYFMEYFFYEIDTDEYDNEAYDETDSCINFAVFIKYFVNNKSYR